MCDAKPGLRCAHETCTDAGQSLEDYIRAWPGGPAVDPVAAAVAVFEHTGAAKADLARALGLTNADVRPALATIPTQRASEPARPVAPDLTSFGPVDSQYGPFPAEGTWNVPDPDAQTIQVEGRTFTRASPSAQADWPDGIRIEADRELSNAEVRQMAGLLGYAQRSTLRGAEGVSGPYRDGPNSFVMYQDATKTYSDDSGATYGEFEDTFPQLVNDGSPVRKTDRSGAGTRGTRLIDGVPDVNVSIWYDNVYISPTANTPADPLRKSGN